MKMSLETFWDILLAESHETLKKLENAARFTASAVDFLTRKERSVNEEDHRWDRECPKLRTNCKCSTTIATFFTQIVSVKIPLISHD